MRLRAGSSWRGLQKTGAVVDRLTFNATIIETGTGSYRPAPVKGPSQPGRPTPA